MLVSASHASPTNRHWGTSHEADPNHYSKTMFVRPWETGACVRSGT